MDEDKVTTQKKVRQFIDLLFEIMWDLVQIMLGLVLFVAGLACVKYIWHYIQTGEIVWRLHG